MLDAVAQNPLATVQKILAKNLKLLKGELIGAQY